MLGMKPVIIIMAYPALQTESAVCHVPVTMEFIDRRRSSWHEHTQHVAISTAFPRRVMAEYADTVPNSNHLSPELRQMAMTRLTSSCTSPTMASEFLRASMS